MNLEKTYWETVLSAYSSFAINCLISYKQPVAWFRVYVLGLTESKTNSNCCETVILAVVIAVSYASPKPGYYGKHEHHTIHVPYNIHTIHHHHVQKVPVYKHIIKEVPVIKQVVKEVPVVKEIVKEVPVVKEVHVPIIKEVHVPVHHVHHEDHVVHKDFSSSGCHNVHN
uniref:Uncharacterized protein n=1 Tax=Glossina pallidipes TaxID=7398 RepID=A0A1B0AFW0_GLOPL